MQWDFAEVPVFKLIDKVRVLILIVLISYVDLGKD